MNNKQSDLDNWDKFSNSFLKAIDVESELIPYVCVNVEVSEEEKLRLTLENNEISYLFDLNKTNINKLKELKVKSPKELTGKKLYFKKVLARNPTTNKEVESLRIYKIE